MTVIANKQTHNAVQQWREPPELEEKKKKCDHTSAKRGGWILRLRDDIKMKDVCFDSTISYEERIKNTHTNSRVLAH